MIGYLKKAAKEADIDGSWTIRSIYEVNSVDNRLSVAHEFWYSWEVDKEPKDREYKLAFGVQDVKDAKMEFKEKLKRWRNQDA